MTLSAPLITMLIGCFLFAGVLLTKSSRRFGVPGLVLYLALGIFIGNGRMPYDFVYDYPEFTLSCSNLALALILFIGGLETSYAHLKPIMGRGLALSTVGVILTAGLVAVFVHLVFGFSYVEGLLIGSVLSSTDAAAVFSILESRQLKLREHISETLELESGTNDPMAFFLTTMFTGLLVDPSSGLADWGVLFFKEMAIGLAAGLLLGAGIVWVLSRASLTSKGMYPVLLLSIVSFGIGLVTYFHGNVLLAMYVAGVVTGTRKDSLHGWGETYLFFKSISWLMEIGLFIVLGLQVFPHSIWPYVPQALLISLFLILVARPVGVFLSLSPFRTSFRKKVFVSWVGLRGATPIVFSLIPLIARVSVADVLFNTVFAVVLISVMVQGTTLGWLAGKLRLLNGGSGNG
ncbi:MAG: potassium/proton antiporter [Siphonobacter aquaeclarae]|nr:potassium/proton antiporter [Siphonobacter aquaeclarae]